MRLIDMGRYFVQGVEIRACGMAIVDDDGITSLHYGGKIMATITDRTADGFTLTLYDRSSRYNKIAFANRLVAVFESINEGWEARRYTAFVRYGEVHIYDTKLRVEFFLRELVGVSFTVKDKIVSLNYEAFERAILSDKPELLAAVKISPATTNSNEAIANLMALVANI